MDPAVLSPDDTHALIAYARQKFAEERWPLRPIREALEKLDPRPEHHPTAPRKPYVPSMLAQRKKAPPG
jgi:hypothetical protein